MAHDGPWYPRCERGLWSLDSDLGSSLGPIGLDVLTERGRFTSTGPDCVTAVEDRGILFSFPHLTVRIDILDVTADSLMYDCTISNTSGEDQRIRSVTSLRFHSTSGPFAVSTDSTVATWPAERSYGADGAHPVGEGRAHDSFWSVSWYDPRSSRGVLAGICDVPRGLAHYTVIPLVDARTENVRILQVACEVDCHSGARGVRLAPGKGLRLGAHYLRLWEGMAAEGPEAYADLLARRFGRPPRGTVPTGWCSWYAYYEDFTEDEALRNLAAAAGIARFDTFQIDMGWETGVGTRRLGEPEVDAAKFPRGLAWMASEIRARGHTPGLWIRPFLGWGEGTDIPVWARGAGINLSHPQARAFVRALARTVTAAWGFGYIKFDFVTYDFFGQWGPLFPYQAYATFEPYDDTLTNVQMYRLGLEALREGAGLACFLLGCNCLLGPALGLVDGNRMGDDVEEESWDCTVAMGGKSVGPLYALNGRVWANDPDCLLVQETLTEGRARLWCSLVSLAGQMGIVSAKLYALSPERREILRAVLPIVDARARPRDAAAANPADVWYAQVTTGWDTYTVVGLFNWTARAKRYRIPLAALGMPAGTYHVHEFWDQRYGGAVSDVLDAMVDGDDCRIFAVRPDVQRPQVLGTSAHLLQGPVELADVRWSDRTRTLTIFPTATRPFDLALYVPPGFRRHDGDGATAAGRVSTIRINAEGGTVALPFIAD